MIPAGQMVTYDLEGQTRATWKPITVAGLRDGVISALTPYMRVSSVSILPREAVYLGILDWTYRATVIAASHSAHARIEDAASIVAHAFAESGNSTPTISARGYGPAQLPGAGTQPPGWLEGLGSGLKTTTIALALGAVAVAVVMLKR